MTSSSITYQFRHETVTANAQRAQRFRSKNFEFVAVDGEGAGFGKDHRYILLGCGERYIENIQGISWKEAFEFLYSCFEEKPRAAFVGFFLGYDFTQLIKTLPESRARILLTERGISSRKRKSSGGNNKPFPVRYQGWEFDMLPGRRLQIRPQACRCHEESRHAKCTHPQREWMYICDSGPFWQCSLLVAIDPQNWREPVVTPEEFAIVEEGKASRSMTIEEYIADKARVLKYMLLENNILQRIMTVLREGFMDIGVNLRKDQWFGPGQAAAAWYKKNRIPRRSDLEAIIPGNYWEAARQSYFGGWFEIFSHGIIPGRSYEYDINSAYPYIIASLPCLLHGRYDSGNGQPTISGDNGLVLCRARLHGDDAYIGAALNRDKDGRIRRPKVTEGWYWQHEIDAGIRAGVISDVDYREWKSYHPCDCENPVRGFRDLYEHRLSVGKDNVLGKSCKLVYNSGYGKFAQSTGSAPYGNWIYASLITAGCRVMILDAIASHPNGTKSVLMVATDAVFFDSPHPDLPVSQNLGNWDSTLRENLTQFKPGVYWDDKSRKAIRDGHATKFKARGINARDFAKHLGQIDDLFLRAIEIPPDFRIKLAEADNFTAYAEKAWPWILFEVGFSLVSAKTALSRGDWSEAGQTQIDLVTIQDSDPADKRANVFYDAMANRLRTYPVDVPPDEIISVPYDKRYGIDDPFSLESRESLGITPNGTVGDQVREYTRILTGEE